MRVWVVRDWSGEAVNAAPEEHDAVGWFVPTQLEQLSSPTPSTAVSCGASGAASAPAA